MIFGPISELSEHELVVVIADLEKVKDKLLAAIEAESFSKEALLGLPEYEKEMCLRIAAHLRKTVKGKSGIELEKALDSLAMSIAHRTLAWVDSRITFYSADLDNLRKGIDPRKHKRP